MKWKNKQRKPKPEWRRWFAWYPVTIFSFPNSETVWLEFVERRLRTTKYDNMFGGESISLWYEYRNLD